jgi:hypothetical protein
MANTITRLLPFRQYSEQDVINMYALDAATGQAGSLVRVSEGDLNKETVELVNYGFTNQMGHATSLYPQVPLKLTKVTATGQAMLGILLRDVRTVDENGENLLFYPQKKHELQCVVSGEAVPVATRGLFMYNVDGLAGGVVPAINSYAIPAGDGKITGVAFASATATQKEFAIGQFIATGSRASVSDTDAFEGAYALLKLEL